MDRPLTYWVWFFRGREGHAGWKRLLNTWLLLDGTIGIMLALVVPEPLREAAKTVLLPLAGALVGMSFVWVGNALALAQSTEIERLAELHPGGFEVYVHPFQSALLVLLGCLVAWGIAGLGIFDMSCPWNCPRWGYYVMGAFLYGLVSFSVRVCWRVVLGAQLMVLYQRAIRNLPEGKQ